MKDIAALDGPAPSRRAVVCATVAGAMMVAAGGVASSRDRAYAANEDMPEFDGQQYGFLVNSGNCINCGKCVQACRENNQTPEDFPARRKITKYSKDGGDPVFVSTSCMHCAKPSCASVCPAGAITKTAGGTVVVDKDRCIGCKYCYQACPFSVPMFTSEGMDKCDMCLGNGILTGQTPHCAQACKFDALHFGLMDSLSDKAASTPQLVSASTGPSFILT